MYCVQAHAPGCPVMIIGTHLDVVRVKEDATCQNIRQFYSDSRSFPTIGDVSCITNTAHIHGSMKTLRRKIYSMAMHLHTNRKNKC